MSARRLFEWDDVKARVNLAKHGVPFDGAIAVFVDPNPIVLDVTKVEDGEVRHKAVGLIGRRLYAVVFTDRNEVTRIISARRCNGTEKKIYGPIRS